MFYPSEVAAPSEALFAYLVSRSGGGEFVAQEAPDWPVDEAHARFRCEMYIRAAIERKDLPTKGNRNQHAHTYICGLYAKRAPDPDYLRAQLSRFWLEAPGVAPDEWPDPGIEDMIRRAFEGRLTRNGYGAELDAPATVVFPTVTQHVSAATMTRTRVEEKFLSFDLDDSFETVDMVPYLRQDRPAPPGRQDLIPDQCAANFFVPIVGVGGQHKSRMAQQITYCKLTDRELFMQREIVDGVNRFRLGGPRPCGGVPVTHIEYLGYEDPVDEVDRRAASLGAHFILPENPCTYRWRRLVGKSPLLWVRAGKSGMEWGLTNLGVRMLTEWEDAALDNTLLIWLDSFFDAITMDGVSRMDDSTAVRVIAALNRWCTLLNATIISPFNRSAAATKDGRMGFAESFRNKSRCVLEIDLKRDDKAPTKPEKPNPITGQAYTLMIHKWNGGPQGSSTRRVFWYENGQLVTNAG